MKLSAPARAALLAAFAALCPAQAGISQLSGYPFDQWAAAPEHAAIKWQVHLPPPELSMHQRLIARVQVIVPGVELEKRRGRGELILLTRFEDAAGSKWRDDRRMDLTAAPPGIRSDELTFTVAAFVKPGDYRVLVALVDSQTGEHSFTTRTLHVPPLKGDPLPQAWTGLPPVEILTPEPTPELWYLPGVTGLLNLPLPESRARLPHIELLINMTPSQRTNATGALRRNMSVVIPALKSLSGLNAKVQAPSAAMIDLTRHRVALEIPDTSSPDWNSFNRLLQAGNPGIIDAKSLAGQSSMRDYFAKETSRRADDSAGPRWLIVLSGPLTLPRQETAPPIQLIPDPNRHIVCYRFSPAPGNGSGALTSAPDSDYQIEPPQRVRGPMPGLGLTLPGGPDRGRGSPYPPEPDDLDLILKPMGAQIVNIPTPLSFRKALAALIQGIASAQPLE